MSIHFRKIYQRVREGDLDYAIVSYSKANWYLKDGKVIQWSYGIVIDLWIAKLVFRWKYPRIK